MDRSAEIDQIKRELDILRTRYALYARGGRMLQLSFWWVAVPTCIIGGLALIVKVFLFDTGSGIFAAAIAAVVILLFWILLRSDGTRQPFSWINLAASPPLPYTEFAQPYFFGRWSDVKILQEQIAEREQRLLELGVPQ